MIQIFHNLLCTGPGRYTVICLNINTTNFMAIFLPDLLWAVDDGEDSSRLSSTFSSSTTSCPKLKAVLKTTFRSCLLWSGREMWEDRASWNSCQNSHNFKSSVVNPDQNSKYGSGSTQTQVKIREIRGKGGRLKKNFPIQGPNWTLIWIQIGQKKPGSGSKFKKIGSKTLFRSVKDRQILTKSKWPGKKNERGDLKRDSS